MICHYAERDYAECRVLLIIMLSVITLSVVMLSAIMQSVIMQSVIMLSVIMLSVMAPLLQYLILATFVSIRCQRQPLNP